MKVLDTWRTLGMRGTGSHDVDIKNAFLPDAVMQGVRRPAGQWHPSMHAVVLVALPIVYAAYLGVAQQARAIALELAAARKMIRWSRRWPASWRTCSSPRRSPTRACWRWPPP